MKNKALKIWEQSRPLSGWFEIQCLIEPDLESRLSETERRGGGRGESYYSRLWGLKHTFLAYLETGDVTATGFMISPEATRSPVVIPKEHFDALRGDHEKIEWDHGLFKYSGLEYSGIRIIRTIDLEQPKKPRGRPRKRDELDNAVRITLRICPQLCSMPRKEGAALVRKTLKDVLKNPDTEKIAKANSTISKAILRVCNEAGFSKS
ncbi:hypothetical protein F1654_05005 [Alkalicaulis satelles]|uniref:Uncharacterized protein n=1 Tax=Alkalicaulis satelles TaxID=2609175 RepID=A0A5M6ZLY8_9PROT|nr:hypothetical protein [Alkalicaulis satelles]KAA5805340.1 hypothetical protein F1654_05005 [Alkalicaulis satelles]